MQGPQWRGGGAWEGHLRLFGHSCLLPTLPHNKVEVPTPSSAMPVPLCYFHQDLIYFHSMDQKPSFLGSPCTLFSVPLAWATFPFSATALFPESLTSL